MPEGERPSGAYRDSGVILGVPARRPDSSSSRRPISAKRAWPWSTRVSPPASSIQPRHSLRRRPD